MKNLKELDEDDLNIHFKAHKGTSYLQKVQKVDESIIEVYDQGDESVEERICLKVLYK